MLKCHHSTPRDQYDPNRYSTIDAFREDPRTCWSLHRVMIDQMTRLSPNAGHRAIARLQRAGLEEERDEDAAAAAAAAAAADDDNDDDEEEEEEEEDDDDDVRRLRVCVVTQNVDGMHQAAGSNPVHELHGSMSRAACLNGCGWIAPIHSFLLQRGSGGGDGGESGIGSDGVGGDGGVCVGGGGGGGGSGDRENDDGPHKRRRRGGQDGAAAPAADAAPSAPGPAPPAADDVPWCSGCGACPAKPDCTLFGEPLPEAAMRAARTACAAADAVIVVGTSLSVYPAAELPQLARRHNPGAPLIEINAVHAETPAGADVTITGKAAEVLPLLVDRILELRRERRAEAAVRRAAAVAVTSRCYTATPADYTLRGEPSSLIIFLFSRLSH